MSFSDISNRADATANANDVTTTAINTTGADLIVMVVGMWETPADATPTDSKSNTWTGTTAQAVSADSKVRIFYCENPSSVGAGHTFTYSRASSFCAVSVMAFSGAKLASVLDDTSGATTTGTTLQPGSKTPSEDNCLVVTGLCMSAAAATASISGNSFTEPTGAEVDAALGNNYGIALARVIQTTAGACNPTWTCSASTALATTMAIFKSAAGGGGGSSIVPIASVHYRHRWS